MQVVEIIRWKSNKSSSSSNNNMINYSLQKSNFTFRLVFALLFFLDQQILIRFLSLFWLIKNSLIQ